jgi:hypothetical protein
MKTTNCDKKVLRKYKESNPVWQKGEGISDWINKRGSFNTSIPDCFQEELEHTKEVIRIRKWKMDSQTTQWPTEKGQTTIYKNTT